MSKSCRLISYEHPAVSRYHSNTESHLHSVRLELNLSHGRIHHQDNWPQGNINKGTRSFSRARSDLRSGDNISRQISLMTAEASYYALLVRSSQTDKLIIGSFSLQKKVKKGRTVYQVEMSLYAHGFVSNGLLLWRPDDDAESMRQS